MEGCEHEGCGFRHTLCCKTQNVIGLHDHDIDGDEHSRLKAYEIINQCQDSQLKPS